MATVVLLTLRDLARVPESLDQVAATARHYMAEFGVGHYEFAFDRGLRRLGYCRYARPGRAGRISLSRHYATANRWAQVRDTILHEIAHARLGHGYGHGPRWKAECLVVGARPERLAREGVAGAAPRYRAECPSCRGVFTRHNRVPAGRRRWCLKCGPVAGLLDYLS